jgi:hypothetical protein
MLKIDKKKFPDVYDYLRNFFIRLRLRFLCQPQSDLNLL